MKRSFASAFIAIFLLLPVAASSDVTFTGVTLTSIDSLQAPFSLPLTNSLITAACPSDDCSPTFTRATIANVTDHEGVVRAVNSGEARFSGARRVENLLAAETSDDWSHTLWVKDATATVTGTNTLNLPAENDKIKQISVDSPLLGGETHAFSVTLSGTGTTRIEMWRTAGGTGEGVSLTVTLTATPTRYTAFTTWAEDHAGLTAYIYRPPGFTATTLTASDAQVENITGNSDLTIPSEYVSTMAVDYTDNVGPELLDNGDFSAWTADDPDGWSIVGESGANMITEVSEAARLVSDGANVYMVDTVLTIGATYYFSIDVTDVTSGQIKLYSSSIHQTMDTVQTYSGVFIADASNLGIGRETACDITFDNVSVKRISLPANIIGVKYFNTRNVCTVASNIATCPGDELHDDLNAASDESGNETDATTGWGVISFGGGTWESQSLVVSTGTYALHANLNPDPTGAGRFRMDLDTKMSLIDGERYVISYDVRHVGTGDRWSCWLDDGGTGTPGDTPLHIEYIETADTAWRHYSVTFVHGDYSNYFGCREDNISQDGGIYFDNFSVQLAPAPLSTVVNKGYLAEEARTNSVLQSRDFDTTWTNTTTSAQDQTGIDGVPNTAFSLEDDGDWEYIAQAVTVLNDSNTHTFSVYIKKDSDETRFVELQLNVTGAGTTQNQSCQINTRTGELDLRSDTGSNDSCTVEDAWGWWRVALTATNIGDGDTAINPTIYPAISGTFGTTDIGHTGTAIFDQAQIELNTSFPTSSIYTTTGTVTRNADVLTYPSDGNISDTAGSVVATTIKDTVSQTVSTWFLDVGDGLTGFDPTAHPRISDGTTFPAHQSAMIDGVSSNVGYKWGSELTSFLDGMEDSTPGSFDGSMDLDSIVSVGSAGSGISSINGNIKNLSIWTQALSDGQMERLTQ